MNNTPHTSENHDGVGVRSTALNELVATNPNRDKMIDSNQDTTEQIITVKNQCGEVQEVYLAVVGDEGARWTDRHNEVRKKFTKALGEFLSASVQEAQAKAEARSGEDFGNDSEYQAEITHLYKTYVVETQNTIGLQDPSFDAAVAALSYPELFAVFATHIQQERVLGPAALIFEGMNTTVLEGLEQALNKETVFEVLEKTINEELVHTFYLARQKYFCARVAQAMGGEHEDFAMFEQHYKDARDAVQHAVQEYAQGKIELLRKSLLKKVGNIFAEDVKLEKEITRYWLMPEKQKRVVPTAVRMKTIRAPWWKATALAIAAFAGLTGDTPSVGEGPGRPAHEDTLNDAEKPNKEEVATVEARVETRARVHGAIETFQWFLYDMDARGLQHERDALIRGVLGDDEGDDEGNDPTNLSQSVQALLLAQKLGFTAERGAGAPSELLTDADFNDPILFADSQFVFDPATNTFMVVYDNNRRAPQVLVRNNAHIANYRQ